MSDKEKDNIYWNVAKIPNSNIPLKGGFYFRVTKLAEFIKLVEKTTGPVVGMRFEDGLVEIICEEIDESNKKKEGWVIYPMEK